MIKHNNDIRTKARENGVYLYEIAEKMNVSEPFNTETKEGRMMRNNLLNFPEFERETIAARVADAYNTKARQTGFYQGGKVYGYVPERRTINGKTGSVLVPSDRAHVITKAFEIYKEPTTSLKYVFSYFQQNGIDISVESKNGRSNMDRSHCSRLLESPLYVRADAEVYRYLTLVGIVGTRKARNSFNDD